MRRVLGAGLAVALLAPFACRDVNQPFEPRDRPPLADSAGLRLTFGSGSDRLPAWSADGDTVYYTSSDYAPLPGALGVVLGIPRTGDAPARAVLRNVQPYPDAAVWLSAPAVSPATERIAYIEVGMLRQPPCDGGALCPTMQLEDLPAPPLDVARLHVRALDSDAGLNGDLILELEPQGSLQVPDTSYPGDVYTLSRHYPFQSEFVSGRMIAFRPSWAPDGGRLVVSDGLRLRIWQPGAASAPVVPGSEDGVMPAWSPDGEWIAYTWLERTDSVSAMCEIGRTTPQGEWVPHCNERRVLYAYESRIALIRPDGSERRVLAHGRDPAWAPDGQSLFFATPFGAIQRVSLEGGEPTPVPHTTGGREPAVSPDGRWLAFARTLNGYDIVVVRLE